MTDFLPHDCNGMRFEELFNRETRNAGDTTPAIRIVDDYREQLDALGDLCKQETHDPDALLRAAQALNQMQSEFRLEHGVLGLSLECNAMADAIDETISLLQEFPADFPQKEEFLSDAGIELRLFVQGKRIIPFDSGEQEE